MPAKVVRAGLVSDQDNLFAVCFHSDRLIGVEHYDSGCSAR